MLTFDESSHTYRWSGVPVPSVTQCLSKLHDFGMVPKDVLQAACERGTIVHKLCEFHDQQDLDAGSVGDYWPYLDAWIDFCNDYGAEWSGIEERHYSQRFGFAGTMDRRGRLRRIPANWVIDVKTSAQAHRVWGMQLSAYRQLLFENVGSEWAMARRGSVQLSKDGKYRFVEWSDPDDWRAFCALITLNTWTSKQ